MSVVSSIQIGQPRTLGVDGAHDFFEKPWVTGIYKAPVAGPVRATVTGIIGDGQADLVNHGGEDKALCAYPGDHYPAWRDIPALAAMGPGAFGENLTIDGLRESDVCIGDVWTAGDVQLQVSQPRQPCWKLARKWGIRDFAEQVVASGRTGWYFRVLRPGDILPGTPLVLTARGEARWTIDAANRVMHGRPRDRDGSLALSQVATLAASWRGTLARR